MTLITLRDATLDDKPAIHDLNARAFGRDSEARIIDRLEADGDAILQIVGVMDEQIVGHILFYNVQVVGRVGACGLGPMCVDPWIQREKIGKAMVSNALKYLQGAGMPIVFVLGHPEYYPRFGFSEETAKPFEAPWSGPDFMAVRLRHGPPMSGRLVFPKAFED